MRLYRRVSKFPGTKISSHPPPGWNEALREVVDRTCQLDKLDLKISELMRQRQQKPKMVNSWEDYVRFELRNHEVNTAISSAKSLRETEKDLLEEAASRIVQMAPASGVWFRVEHEGRSYGVGLMQDCEDHFYVYVESWTSATRMSNII